MTRTTITCRDCAADLEHCHGVAIRHPDGTPDCTEDTPCGLPANAHWASMDCVEIRCDCLIEIDLSIAG